MLNTSMLAQMAKCKVEEEINLLSKVIRGGLDLRHIDFFQCSDNDLSSDGLFSPFITGPVFFFFFSSASSPKLTIQNKRNIYV